MSKWSYHQFETCLKRNIGYEVMMMMIDDKVQTICPSRKGKEFNLIYSDQIRSQEMELSKP